MAEEALAAAAVASAEIAAGRHRGPLHGVPIAVKDVFATKNVRTTAASKLFGDWVPTADSAVVKRLHAAGAVIIGKTHLNELACGATGLNPHYGPARNPWNVTHISGGSSSGSAVAVASEMCFAALGTDTGGSTRIPASLCGVYAIKPTYGIVNLEGMVPLARSLDHAGIIARSMRDCSLVLDAIVEPNAVEASTSLEVTSDTWPCTVLYDRPLAGLRIGAVVTDFETDSQIATVVSDQIQTLRTLGAQVCTMSLEQTDEFWSAGNIVLLSEASTFHRTYLEQRRQDFSEAVRTRMEWGIKQTVEDYAHSKRFLQAARRGCDRAWFESVDVLAMPSTMISAMPLASAADTDHTLELSYLTAPFNFTGQPAVTIPCGLTSLGLPIGLQLVGRRFNEVTVMRVASILEREIGKLMPPPLINEV